MRNIETGAVYCEKSGIAGFMFFFYMFHTILKGFANFFFVMRKRIFDKVKFLNVLFKQKILTSIPDSLKFIFKTLVTLTTS